MLRKGLGGRHDGKGKLHISGDAAHRLFQQKMLSRIGSGQQLRGCMRVFGPTREGIGLTRFKQLVDGIGMNLSKDDALRLFSRYDTDGSGHIDLYELVTNLLPKDYSKRTWQSINYEREEQKQQQRKQHYLKIGKKAFQATEYPPRLTKSMQPNVEKVVKMIATKIRTCAKDGRERDYALKLFGSPVNGISRTCFKNTLARNSIPCSDEVLDSIFDKLQECGLVAFEKLWKRVMPVDGRVSIGWTHADEEKVGLGRFARNGTLKRKLRERQQRQKALNDKSSSLPALAKSKQHSRHMRSLPKLGNKTPNRMREYSVKELKGIMRQRILSHSYPEKYSYNTFDRRNEIPFRVFRKGLKLMGVPAGTSQAEAIFKQYDNNTELVNHRRFFLDIVDPKVKRGPLEQRCLEAAERQRRGPATPGLPPIYIRIQHGDNNLENENRSKSALAVTPIKKLSDMSRKSERLSRKRRKNRLKRKKPERVDTCPWGAPNGRQPIEEK